MFWTIKYDNEGPIILKSDYLHLRFRKEGDSGGWIEEHIASSDNKSQQVKKGDVVETFQHEDFGTIWERIQMKVMTVSEMGKLVDDE